jgi:hypothetical protein
MRTAYSWSPPDGGGHGGGGVVDLAVALVTAAVIIVLAVVLRRAWSRPCRAPGAQRDGITLSGAMADRWYELVARYHEATEAERVYPGWRLPWLARRYRGRAIAVPAGSRGRGPR